MKVDVIVPTIAGREESLERCVESYKATVPDDVNVIVVSDSKTCGWGWRQGLIASRAPYILLACDDQECISDTWLERCVEAIRREMIPCPRVWTPERQIASQGGDMDAYAHIIRRPQKDWTPVDYTTIPFLSREMAQEIGMGDWHYCSDVWVSYRGRQLGYETVLRHGFDVVHYEHSVGRGAGMTVLERDAIDETAMREELAQCESSLQAA